MALYSTKIISFLNNKKDYLRQNNIVHFKVFYMTVIDKLQIDGSYNKIFKIVD